jgi:hypothetical protein
MRRRRIERVRSNAVQSVTPESNPQGTVSQSVTTLKATVLSYFVKVLAVETPFRRFSGEDAKHGDVPLCCDKPEIP